MPQSVPIPKIDASVELVSTLSKNQIAENLEQALGITFNVDFQGTFEELNAYVSNIFTHVIGLTEEPLQGFSKFYLDFTQQFSISYIGFDLESTDFISIDSSKFLALYLQYQAKLPFQPFSTIVEEEKKTNIQELIEIPEFLCSLRSRTTLSLPQIAARIGVALGVNFGAITKTSESIEQSSLSYMCSALALAHRVTLTALSNPGSSPKPRQIFLRIEPHYNLSIFQIPNNLYNPIKIDVSAYFLAFINKETDLKFEI